MVLAGALSKKAGRQTLFTVYFRRNRVRSKVERLSVGTGDRAVIIAGRSVDRVPAGRPWAAGGVPRGV